MRRQTQNPRSVNRTTIVLERVLNANVDTFCMANGISKGELVSEALTEYFRRRKLDPTMMPEIKMNKLPTITAGLQNAKKK